MLSGGLPKCARTRRAWGVLLDSLEVPALLGWGEEGEQLVFAELSVCSKYLRVTAWTGLPCTSLLALLGEAPRGPMLVQWAAFWGRAVA